LENGKIVRRVQQADVINRCASCTRAAPFGAVGLSSSVVRIDPQALPQ
jgi:hypothetical protein